MRGQGGGEARDDDTVTLGPSKAALALATREVVERRHAEVVLRVAPG